MPDKLTVKAIKRARQKTGSYCGPAVFEMLVSAFGLELDQESMVDACDARDTVMKEGITLEGLTRGVKKIYPSLNVWKKEKAEMSDIQKLLELGFVVGFDWQGIFNSNEYGDEIGTSKNIFLEWWKKITKEPIAIGDQGHYSIALEVNTSKGYLRFADPYGHYAGKDRFVAIWEFEERWWDDRIGLDEAGKKICVIEEKLIFVVTDNESEKLTQMGMVML